MAVGHAFLENVVQLRVQGVDVPGGRGARGHELFPVFVEFDEVEIVAAVGHGGGADTGPFARAEERQSRRQSQRLLTSGEQHVDAQFVHRNRHGGEGRHAVHNEHDLGIFLHYRGDVGEGIEHAGRRFVVDEGDGIETALGEFLVDQLGQDGFPPFHLQAFGLLAAALAHVEPLVGERAAHAVEHFLLHEIADGAFHHTPGGRGREIDRAFRAEELLQARMHRLVKGGKFAAAVADLRMAESAESFFRYFHGSRDEEFHVAVGRLVGRVEHKISFPK